MATKCLPDVGGDGDRVGRKAGTYNDVPGGVLVAFCSSLELSTPGSHT